MKRRKKQEVAAYGGNAHGDGSQGGRGGSSGEDGGWGGYGGNGGPGNTGDAGQGGAGGDGFNGGGHGGDGGNSTHGDGGFGGDGGNSTHGDGGFGGDGGNSTHGDGGFGGDGGGSFDGPSGTGGSCGDGGGDRTFKLGSGTTSEDGRYVESLGDPLALADQTMEFVLGVLDDLMSGDPARGDQALAVIESYDPGFYQSLIDALTAAAGGGDAGIITLELQVPKSLAAQGGGSHTIKITIEGSVTIKKNSWFSVAGVKTEFLDDTTFKGSKTFEFKVDCGEGVEITSRTRTTKTFKDETFAWGDEENGGKITINGKITITVEVAECKDGEVGSAPVDPGGGDRMLVGRDPEPVTSPAIAEIAEMEAYFFGIFNDLFSGNSGLQVAALEELWNLDPDIYPSMLESLLPSADEAGQEAILQLIEDYWGSNGDFAYRTDTEGFDWCFVFKVNGTVKIKGHLILDLPWPIGEQKVEIDEKFPVGWSSANDCGDCVLKTRTTRPVDLTGIPFVTPAFPIPYTPGATVKIDVKIEVNLKLVVEGYQCNHCKTLSSLRAVEIETINAVLTTGPVSVPNTFTNGTTADANEVNANFAALETAVNTALANRATNCAALGGTWDAATSTFAPPSALTDDASCMFCHVDIRGDLGVNHPGPGLP